MQEYIRVQIGTTTLEVPKRVTNPTTGKTQDLANLSEDGYCLKFLAAWSHFNKQNAVNLDEAPVITLDKDRWELEETENHVVARKREADSKFGEMVLGADDE